MKNLLKIVPTKSDGEGPVVAHGTKFYANNQEVSGIVRANVIYEVDDVVRAELEVLLEAHEIDGAEYAFFMTDPVSGERRKLAAVEWADGERLDLFGLTVLRNLEIG